MADFDREIAINLKTTVLVSQAAIEALEPRPKGRIVNFASIAYFEPQSTDGDLQRGQGGVAGFTRSLALELEDRKIRVNAVAPGMVRTGDNVASAGGDAAYVELQRHHRRRDVSSPAPPTPPVTGHILPISPRALARKGLMELARPRRAGDRRPAADSGGRWPARSRAGA